MKKDNLFHVFIALTVLLLFFGIGTKLFVDKVTDRVIEKLKIEYSPSPYGPTINPDEIDLDKVKSN